MIQELADHIWDNSRFHEAAARTQRTWLARELGKPIDDEVAAEDAVKLMEAAAVLACSSDAEHRRQAYRAATMTYEILGSSSRPMQQALRVVLNRLGNFPAIETRVDVRDSASDLPFDLLVEELAFSDKHRVLLRERPVSSPDFNINCGKSSVTGKALPWLLRLLPASRLSSKVISLASSLEAMTIASSTLSQLAR